MSTHVSLTGPDFDGRISLCSSGACEPHLEFNRGDRTVEIGVEDVAAVREALDELEKFVGKASPLTVSDLVARSHGTSKAKGWWAKDEALISLANKVLAEPLRHENPAGPVYVAGFTATDHATARRILQEQRDEEHKIPEKLMLAVSELAEALEEHRNKHAPDFVYWVDGSKTGEYTPGTDSKVKPEGIPVELADVVIRVGDFCGRWGIDLEAAVRIKMAHNETRPARHGGKVC